MVVEWRCAREKLHKEAEPINDPVPECRSPLSSRTTSSFSGFRKTEKLGRGGGDGEVGVYVFSCSGGLMIVPSLLFSRNVISVKAF